MTTTTFPFKGYFGNIAVIIVHKLWQATLINSRAEGQAAAR